MATVTDSLKESLLGTSQEPQLSQETRDEDGEFYMSESDFVDAIAPEGEDYVRCKAPFAEADIG